LSGDPRFPISVSRHLLKIDFFMGTGNKYPDFNHAANELSAYTMSVGIFIISLKNAAIIHFEPNDATAFEQWLVKCHVRDIRKNKETDHA
jgi:hypothetical protein